MSIRRDRKKKKQEAKLRKEKRKREKRKAGPKIKLMERLKKTEEFSDTKFLAEPPGQVKMSEIIMDFVGPMLERTSSRLEKENMILMAITAWNMCLLPKKEQKKVLANFKSEKDMDEEGMNIIKEMVELMSAYRKEFYPDVSRFILDYEFTESRDDMHLNVVSSMEPPE